MSGQDGRWEQLTPPVALLVRPSGTTHPAVDRHEFTWSDKCCL